MANNKELGRLGEDLACEYLISLGYNILERNFANKVGELDIIAFEDEILAFVEVKTRTGSSFGLPSEAVSLGKQKKIAKTALSYVAYKRLFDCMCRFDVIEVNMENQDNKINLIKDAFQYNGRYGY